jgi:hypothetical protein
MSYNYVKPEIFAVEMQSVLMVGSHDASEDFNLGGDNEPGEDGGFNAKQRGGGISWSSLEDED